MMETLTDFPKIECPFLRQTFPVNKDQFAQCGSRYGLRAPEVRLAVDRVSPGFEWVFDDPDTIAVEKLNGTNIKIMTEAGRLVGLQNRKNVIDPLQILTGKTLKIRKILIENATDGARGARRGNAERRMRNDVTA